ncbi:MAG: hypothetical protein IKN06_05330 [Bacteroidales bacterium]|nr:hypothetical protein [Bacteroidales bacterium]
MKKKVSQTVPAEEKERKEKRAKALELSINFLGNVIAIILGVVITFMIQDKIDRANELKEVESALELVRTELVTNREDIQTIGEYLDQERRSANYYLAHQGDLKKCPPDSLEFHSGILLADVYMTLSHDALELLKMSSLFQKIGDNQLSMKIIRAYDTCSSIAANFTRLMEVRHGSYKGRIDEDFLLPLTTQADSEMYTDATDIDEAIKAVDAYLRK